MDNENNEELLMNEIEKTNDLIKKYDDFAINSDEYNKINEKLNKFLEQLTLPKEQYFKFYKIILEKNKILFGSIKTFENSNKYFHINCVYSMFDSKQDKYYFYVGFIKGCFENFNNEINDIYNTLTFKFTLKNLYIIQTDEPDEILENIMDEYSIYDDDNVMNV